MATNTEISTGLTYCRRVATAHALAAPGSNTSFLSTSVTADGTTGITPSAHANAWRVTISLATSSVLDVYVTDGSTAYTLHLNGGTALTASCLYTFTFGVSATKQDGATALVYQLRVATDSVIQQLAIDEVAGPVI